MTPSRSLQLKSMLVGSSLEGMMKQVRWFSGLRQRTKHPELWEIYLEERLLPIVLQRLLTKSSNVLDIGAHIGSFLSTASSIATDGKHTAIEASRSKAVNLMAKFPNATIKNVAVSDYIGSATFEDSLQNPGFSKLEDGHPIVGETIRYPVRVATLDSLDIDKIDLIKIDIEGAELSALKGGTKLIENNRPPIIFECGPVYVQGLDRFALFDYFTQQISYDVFLFQDFLYDKGPLGRDEFRKCGVYPFRAFNFIAMPNALGSG
jgi:FkbM family methyltransferase